jgi:hypothetical protein
MVSVSIVLLGINQQSMAVMWFCFFSSASGKRLAELYP